MDEGMERWRGKYALVTGASAGIGYAIAKTLAIAGVNVIGCARNPASLEVYHLLPAKYQLQIAYSLLMFQFLTGCFK